MKFEFQNPEREVDKKLQQLRLKLAWEYPNVPSVARSRFVMASHLADKVLQREKSTTIRFDKHAIEYPTGPVIPLYSLGEGQRHIYARCLANLIVHSVRYEPVDDLTEDDAVADGFASRDELINTLEFFYGRLAPHDVVCIYAFSLA